MKNTVNFSVKMSCQLLKIKSHEDVSLILKTNKTYSLYEQTNKMSLLLIDENPLAIEYIKNPSLQIKLKAIENCDYKNIVKLFSLINPQISSNNLIYSDKKINETNLSKNVPVNMAILEKCGRYDNITLFKLMEQTEKLNYIAIRTSTRNIYELFDFIEDITYDMVLEIFKNLSSFFSNNQRGFNYIYNDRLCNLFEKLKDEHKTEEIILYVIVTCDISNIDWFYKTLPIKSDKIKKCAIENMEIIKSNCLPETFYQFHDFYLSLDINDNYELSMLFVNLISCNFELYYDNYIHDEHLYKSFLNLSLKMIKVFKFTDEIIIYIINIYLGDDYDFFNSDLKLSENVILYLLENYKGQSHKLVHIKIEMTDTIQLKILEKLKYLECLNFLMTIPEPSENIVMEVFHKCNTVKLHEAFFRVCDMKKIQLSHDNKIILINDKTSNDLIEMILSIGNIEVGTYLEYYGILGNRHFDKVKNPTESFYMEIVKHDWYNLSYVPLNCRTKKMCKIGIKQNFLARMYNYEKNDYCTDENKKPVEKHLYEEKISANDSHYAPPLVEAELSTDFSPSAPPLVEAELSTDFSPSAPPLVEAELSTDFSPSAPPLAEAEFYVKSNLV